MRSPPIYQVTKTRPEDSENERFEIQSTEVEGFEATIHQIAAQVGFYPEWGGRFLTERSFAIQFVKGSPLIGRMHSAIFTILGIVPTPSVGTASQKSVS